MSNPYESPRAPLLSPAGAFSSLPGESPTWTRYIVLAGFSLVAVIAYLQRNGLGVVAERVQKDLLLDSQQMGWVMGSFFLTYGAVQIPAGWLASRWGTRRTLTLFVVLWSLATTTIGLSTGFVALLIAQLAMGSAQAGVFPCAVGSLARWLPPTRRGMASGALASSMSAGSALGVALAGALIAYLSWRWVFVLYSLPGFFWAVWFVVWFRNEPGEHAAVNAAELALIRGQPDVAGAESAVRDGVVRESVPWLAILSTPAMWLICWQHFFRAAGYIFYATWFPRFLREVHGVSLLNSGLLASLPLMVVIAGSPLGGMASDWVVTRSGSRRIGRQLFAATCMLLCAGLILVAWRVRDPVLAALVISAGSFCAAFGGPCAYAITMDMGGKHVSTVFSVMNAFGSLGAASFPVVVPYLVKHSGWNTVMVVFAGIYVAAALCWIAFDPHGTIGGSKNQGGV